MRRPLLHLLPPVLLTIAFLSVACLPVETLGCRNRGLWALGIALASGLAAIATAATAVVLKARKNPASNWWMLSTLIFSIPVVLLLFLA